MSPANELSKILIQNMENPTLLLSSFEGIFKIKIAYQFYDFLENFCLCVFSSQSAMTSIRGILTGFSWEIDTVLFLFEKL